MASNTNNSYHRPSVVGGVVLIVLGLLFILQSYLHIDLFDKLWPLLLVAAGIGIIVAAKKG